MKTLFLPLFLVLSTHGFAFEMKTLILKHKTDFARLLQFSTDSVIAEDELFQCYERPSTNVYENLVGGCYLNENGSLYFLAITEELGRDYKIQYPVFKAISLNQEL